MVCTANICRSPIAESLLAKRWEGSQGLDGGKLLEISSAGFLTSGIPSPKEAIDVGHEFGIDISSHLSRQVSPDQIAASDLILTMTRQHVIAISAIDDTAFTKTFSLKELIRRSEAITPGDQLRDWLRRLNERRDRRELLGVSQVDDVADPYGRPIEIYRSVTGELAALTDSILDLLGNLGGDSAVEENHQHQGDG